ncbi:MAG: bifunctional oligoribonuclease/PAP phosphatase NrnA [Bacilli bacterium]|nr:bifunctional oligoribonuclease/PAP phosphatase NrnA [Bacilli bacterium]
MFSQIYETIKKFDKIVLARHVGPDPDAMSSTMALRDSIRLTFPEKHVYAIGSGSQRFTYFGHLDKIDDVSDALLIVLDTPDIRRIDGANLSDFEEVIKIDHHPFVDKFGELELIDDTASSAAELVLELINNTPLVMDKGVASKLYLGIVSDTNRFMFNNSTSRTFKNVSSLIDEYQLNINELYEPLYLRPFNEVKFEGYIGLNLKITADGVAYIKLPNNLLEEFGVDAASPGNMINNFNFIDEVLVWVFFTEDVKNENIRVSARSRGPVINEVLSHYNGGGHKYASGARVKTFSETDLIINDLNAVSRAFKNKNEGDKIENK